MRKETDRRRRQRMQGAKRATRNPNPKRNPKGNPNPRNPNPKRSNPNPLPPNNAVYYADSWGPRLPAFFLLLSKRKKPTLTRKSRPSTLFLPRRPDHLPIFSFRSMKGNRPQRQRMDEAFVAGGSLLRTKKRRGGFGEGVRRGEVVGLVSPPPPIAHEKTTPRTCFLSLSAPQSMVVPGRGEERRGEASSARTSESRRNPTPSLPFPSLPFPFGRRRRRLSSHLLHSYLDGR